MKSRRKNDNKRATGAHVALALALFLTGGELITVGIESTDGMYSALFAYALLCLLSMAAAHAARDIFSVGKISELKGAFQKINLIVFGSLLVLSAALVAVGTADSLANFVRNVMLLETPRGVVIITFFAFCIFLASKGITALKKFALVSFLTVGGATLLLFLLSIPLLDLGKLSFDVPRLPDISRTAEIFTVRFAPFGVAVAYFGCEAERERGCGRPISPLSTLFGVLIGGALLTVCYLNVALLLGSDFARGEEYPYSVAVSAISAGKLFLRMEALSYATYLVAAALRASIAVGAIWEIVRKFILPKGESVCEDESAEEIPTKIGGEV